MSSKSKACPGEDQGMLTSCTPKCNTAYCIGDATDGATSQDEYSFYEPSTSTDDCSCWALEGQSGVIVSRKLSESVSLISFEVNKPPVVETEAHLAMGCGRLTSHKARNSRQQEIHSL